MYLEVLVIAEDLDNILFCHYSKIVFENENLAIFAGSSQKDSCPPTHHVIGEVTCVVDATWYLKFLLIT